MLLCWVLCGRQLTLGGSIDGRTNGIDRPMALVYVEADAAKKRPMTRRREKLTSWNTVSGIRKNVLVARSGAKKKIVQNVDEACRVRLYSSYEKLTDPIEVSVGTQGQYNSCEVDG